MFSAFAAMAADGSAANYGRPAQTVQRPGRRECPVSGSSLGAAVPAGGPRRVAPCARPVEPCLAPGTATPQATPAQLSRTGAMKRVTGQATRYGLALPAGNA